MDTKPSRNEDEYFAKLDAERIKELRAKLDAERVAAARAATLMKCPKDGSDLKEVAIGNVKVDTCPTCKGMWLDAGELELLGAGGDSGLKGFVRDIFKGIRNK